MGLLIPQNKHGLGVSIILQLNHHICLFLFFDLFSQFFPASTSLLFWYTEFSWDDVKADKHRENYLGHSLKAPVGRWQKGIFL